MDQEMGSVLEFLKLVRVEPRAVDFHVIQRWQHLLWLLVAFNFTNALSIAQTTDYHSFSILTLRLTALVLCWFVRFLCQTDSPSMNIDNLFNFYEIYFIQWIWNLISHIKMWSFAILLILWNILINPINLCDFSIFTKYNCVTPMEFFSISPSNLIYSITWLDVLRNRKLIFLSSKINKSICPHTMRGLLFFFSISDFVC